MTSDTQRPGRGGDIAIIGMAGRFPGAPDIETFWANIRDGVSSIRTLADVELEAAGVGRAELNDPDYVKACPVLDDIDKFDAAFFGLSPRDASVMDPAHRIFLELAWHAVEHAGYTALPGEGPVGVFASAGAPLYMIENLRSNPELMRSMGEFLVRHTGNDPSFLATRVSYQMDLRGPSMNVQTACSSALVSLHLACQSLLLGECTMALAGAATVLLPHKHGYMFKPGEILSPDGRCRPFDAQSAGTVFGSGAGVVVLKRLSDALDDGDTIHAIVKGSAVNNDGSLKVGYLAPGVEGQAEVIKSALAAAGVPADSISYIETHGTGTLVGDPIEVEALNTAFRSETARRSYCAIGSVKSNIGHLGEAASVASLIKAVMALKHRQLPPSLGYETPNPAIDLADSPFFVNASLRPWTAAGPRRCGVTALGAGGANCHVILEEAPPPVSGEGERACQLLVLSAKTRSALDRASDNLADALEADASIGLADAAFTLALGRRAMPHRRTLVAQSRHEALARLRARDPGCVATDPAEGAPPVTVFMFPGGGAQYARMGVELYQQDPTYRDAVDACLAIINPVIGRDLGALMFCVPADAEAATRTLERPSLTLPALFTAEYAMARLFESWGCRPGALIGHSMGEYVAACLSGVMNLDDALRLVMARGRLFEATAPGGMLSVPLSEKDLLAVAPADLSVAAINAPELSVASGPAASIDALQVRFAGRGVETTRLRIDVAAHSTLLDPVLDEFRRVCRTISLHPPAIPFVSNVTGAWISAAEATDPVFRVRHLRSPVRFADGLATISDLGNTALVEIGPGRTLSMLARAQGKPFAHVCNTMRHPQEAAGDLAYALTALGRVWTTGAQIDLAALYDGQLRNRVPLPGYAFDRKSFWVEPGKAMAHAEPATLGKRDLDEWFHSVGFSEAALVESTNERAARRWLLVSETPEAARALSKALAPDPVVVACHGRRLALGGPGSWRLDFDRPEHFVDLMNAVETDGGRPDHVVFITSRGRSSAWAGPKTSQRSVARNFLHPTWLVQSLAAISDPVQLSIVTTGLSDIERQTIDPHSALALGPVRVAPRELPHLRTRCIDLPTANPLAGIATRTLARLVDELRAESDDQQVALRPGGRFVQSVAPLSMAPGNGPAPDHWIRENGVYLITGGLGGIGLGIAGHLARAKGVRLALLSRRGLPPEAKWDEILSMGGDSLAARGIASVRALRALGAEVVVLGCDITDRTSLKSALDAIRGTFGDLNGVIHAAGLIDDAPMMSRTSGAMHAVLAPKVAGTLALDALIPERLDVFVLFSSVASLLGLAGQVDYTAANAFLDAFARSRSTRAPGRTVVVNWNAWNNVGMAAAAHRNLNLGPDPALPSAHPDLDGYTDRDGERTVTATFNAEAHWLLSEHRIRNGSALLPGAALVELARAVCDIDREPGPVELSNLTLLAPFQVAAGETRRLTITLQPGRDATDIAMHAGGEPILVAEARHDVGPPPAPIDLDGVAQRCQLREWIPADGFLAQGFVDFGPRWANIRRVRYGRSQALLELSLDDRFAEEVGLYGLHPAILDMATGGVQALIPGIDLAADFYVPLSYGRIRIFSTMPRRVFSHVRCLPDTADGLAHFDVTLADAEGNIFADIARFTMKRIDMNSALSVPVRLRERAGSIRRDALAAVLREGISPLQGLEAFERIMRQPRLVQVVASSVDVDLWRRQLDAVAPRADDSAVLEGFERPELAADYEATTWTVEQALAALWSELLGVRRIGARDSFFDLGGNSLVALRLFAAIRKRFGVTLPLATLFEAPTIAGLACLLTEQGDAHAGLEAGAVWSPLVRISDGAAKTTPLFCVHGAGGHVLCFTRLAASLNGEFPFYGMQAQGLDGKLPTHETVEDMAQCYLAAIRKVQPQGPYLLAGYSGGGVIALEMAQQLKQGGETVGLLAMIDTLDPTEMRSPITVLDRARQFHRVSLRQLWNWPRNRLRDLRDARFARTLAGQRVDEAQMMDARTVDAVMVGAHFRAQSLYQPQTYDGDILLFRATEVGTYFLRSGDALGWDKYVKGRIDVVSFAADHKSILDEPAVSNLGEKLIDRLSRAIARQATPEPQRSIASGSGPARQGIQVGVPAHAPV